MLEFIVLALVIGYYGQHMQDTSKKNHIESMDVSYSAPQVGYDFKDADGKSSASFGYEPEVIGYTGVEISSKKFNVGFNFTNGSYGNSEEDDYRKPSKVYDFQFSGTFKNFLWGTYYQKYTGFYLTDNNINQETENTQHELEAINYGTNLLYLTNKDVDPDELFFHNTKNRVTDHTYIIGLSYNRARIHSNETIVPDEHIIDYPDFENVDTIETNSTALNLGWGGQYAWKKFFVNGYLAVSYVSQKQYLSNQGIYHSPAEGSLFMLDYGYRGIKGIFGMHLRSQSYETKINDQIIDQTRNIGTFYYRYFF